MRTTYFVRRRTLRNGTVFHHVVRKDKDGRYIQVKGCEKPMTLAEATRMAEDLEGKQLRSEEYL